MDENASPAAAEATTNGESRAAAALSGQLENLHLSQTADGSSPGEPAKTPGQDPIADGRSTAEEDTEENGTTAQEGSPENGKTGPGDVDGKKTGQEEPAGGVSPDQEEPAGGVSPDQEPAGGVSPDQEPAGGVSPDQEAGSESEVGAALTFRWQVVELDGDGDAETPPLEFPKDAFVREASNKRWRPQGPVKKLMESYHVFVIKKPPAHHKNAKYVCRVCELHWDTLHAVQKHVGDQRHTVSTLRHQELTAVHTLPEPTSAQTARLTELLSSVFAERGLTAERMQARRRVAEQLKDTLRDGLEKKYGADECRLEVFGSSRHGCGFEDSSLDVALLPAEESAGSAQLTHSIQVLQDSELFTDVTHDFTGWTPNVRCLHAVSGQPCQLALGAERDVQLAQLIELYAALDDRLAPLAVALRHLAQVCEMDRPHAGSLPPSAFVLMTVYYLQQCEPPVLPVLHEMVGDPTEEPPAELDIAAAAAASASWRSENASDLGTLWLRLLRFYALELTESDVVVSVRQRQLVTRADKGWASKKISIEDPVQHKRNICRSISSSAVADLIVDRLRAACLLFGVPRTVAGAAIQLVSGRGPPPPAAAALLADRLAGLTQQQLEYQFDRHLLCGETTMPVVCSVCQKTGHLADDCPTLVVPPAEPLPTPSAQQTQLLDRICGSVFNDWAPPAEEYNIRQSMLHGIESYIRHHAFPSARLTLFGSSCNGFGFRNSDLDICMTFEDCTDPQSLDQPEIILKLANTLNRLRSVCNVIPISTAKVPIVKFSDRRSRLEGDISLYNTLAQHNTLLLHTYAKLDSRARVLGYMVKLMAKICDICDASRGSLSSYAYTLLLIYYLQRCEPAVLPVLQELDPDGRPTSRVDGSDVSFFTDLNRLHQHWPGAGRNTRSVGELWLGFLRFYGEEFDFDRHVVCIRRTEVLTKFEKLWNSAFIAIEDPFLLSHNLGGGVRRKMAAFIRRSLLRWRLHHLRPTPSTLPHGYRDFRAFLMSAEHLCEGPPPNAGGCHACGRIGHWAADCPRRRRRPATEEGPPHPQERQYREDGRHPAQERQYREEGRQPPQERQYREPAMEPARPVREALRPAMEPARPVREALRPAREPPGPRPAAAAAPPSQAEVDHAARLLAMLGACAGPAEQGPRRVPGTHLAASLERVPGTFMAASLEHQQQQQSAQPAAPRPLLGPPPGLAPPDLTQALLAQLRQPAPWQPQWLGLAPPQQAAGWPRPQQAPPPVDPAQWPPPWGGLGR